MLSSKPSQLSLTSSDDYTAPTCSLCGDWKNIPSGVLIFMLWTFSCFNSDFNVCMCMVVFTHYCATNHFKGATLALKMTTWWWHMSKHVRDLLMSDVHILVHVMFISINFYTMYSTYNIKIQLTLPETVMPSPSSTGSLHLCCQKMECPHPL